MNEKHKEFFKKLNKLIEEYDADLKIGNFYLGVKLPGENRYYIDGEDDIENLAEGIIE